MAARPYGVRAYGISLYSVWAVVAGAAASTIVFAASSQAAAVRSRGAVALLELDNLCTAAAVRSGAGTTRFSFAGGLAKPDPVVFVAGAAGLRFDGVAVPYRVRPAEAVAALELELVGWAHRVAVPIAEGPCTGWGSIAEGPCTGWQLIPDPAKAWQADRPLGWEACNG